MTATIARIIFEFMPWTRVEERFDTEEAARQWLEQRDWEISQYEGNPLRRKYLIPDSLTHIDTSDKGIEPLCRNSRRGDSFVYVHPNDLHQIPAAVTCGACRETASQYPYRADEPADPDELTPAARRHQWRDASTSEDEG